MLLLIAVLAATGAQAQVDLHGILTTGNHTARVDSVSLEVGGAQVRAVRARHLVRNRRPGAG
jgi:hypothetical protein